MGPQQQKIWGRLAVINFTFGSAGAGLYLVWAWSRWFSAGFAVMPGFIFTSIVAVGCVVFGLVAVAGEAGKPARARFLLGNVRRSWMSRETLAAVVFVPAALLAAVSGSNVLIGVAAGAAATFITSQAFILFRARAVPAWNFAMVPAIFVSSALASGSGLLLTLSANSRTTNPAVLIIAGTCAAADLLFWEIYLRSSPNDQFRNAIGPLQTRRAILTNLAVGRALPMVIIVIAAFRAQSLLLPHLWLAAAGLVLFAASWSQKGMLIRGCGYLAPLTLRLQITPPVSKPNPMLDSLRSRSGCLQTAD